MKDPPHTRPIKMVQWKDLGRFVFDMARCFLLESKLPKSLWVYAVATAVYTRNRCYNTCIGKTPFEALIGQMPNVGNMHLLVLPVMPLYKIRNWILEEREGYLSDMTKIAMLI